MVAFYNEFDSFAAQWLRNLIDAGHIAPGVVDERSIWDIAPEELDGFTQCHFFAGIGVWSHALRSAGWPDDRPVWTASCPCQPFSTAGTRAGTSDERHAWPAVLWLAQARRPSTIFGEQVSSKDGLAWFDIVQADLDGEGYTVSGLDTCAAGVGAPHRRQRLYFVADAVFTRSQGQLDQLRSRNPAVQVAPSGSRKSSCVADPDSARSQGHRTGSGPRAPSEEVSAGGTCGSSTFWDCAEWVYCNDPSGPRWRPIEPGAFPLADGAPSRVGRLRAYGNALCAPQAEAFVRARMDLEVTA